MVIIDLNGSTNQLVPVSDPKCFLLGLWAKIWPTIAENLLNKELKKNLTKKCKKKTINLNPESLSALFPLLELLRTLAIQAYSVN